MSLSLEEVEKLRGQNKAPIAPANLTSAEAAVLWANTPWRNRLISVWASIVILPPLAVIALLFFKIYRWDRKTQQVMRIGRWTKAGLLVLALFASALLITRIIESN